MINLTRAFLVFVICGGLFGIVSGLRNSQDKDPILTRKSFLRGSFTLAFGLGVLILFESNILGNLIAIGAIGILLVSQEYALGRIAGLGAKKVARQNATNENPSPVEPGEGWDQIRRKGRGRFVLVNTALYGSGGVVLTLFAAVFAPQQFPLYMLITIILAGAAGGATVAIRQWDWHERNERSVRMESGSKAQKDY